MKKKELNNLTEKELKSSEKGLKLFILLFMPIILGLFYYAFRDYFDGKEIDLPLLTIAICTLSGPIVIYPELKKIQKELKRRK